MPGELLWGWYPVGNRWVKLQVDINGRLVVDPTALFEEPPVNGELEKGATSNWCFDHNADVNAHHARNHKDRHDPEDGADKLDTAVPVKVGAANAMGTSHSLARADHVHEREHARYTDAEVDALIAVHAAFPTVHQDAPALIATHTAIAAAHHARYTDAEVNALIAVHAVLAATHGRTNIDGVVERDAAIATHKALAAAHHAAFTQANHTAIGDAAPHHAKTVDASELTAGILPLARLQNIANAQIAAAAAIAYSKLNLAASIVMADFAAAIKNAANGIVVLDASADVPTAQIPEHMSKNKLSWTANKLLKGAGVGTNPTEIEVPAGKSIATGTYAADNTDDRQITTGFKCSYVFLVALETGTHYSWRVTPDATLRIGYSAGTNPLLTTDVVLHATDGFVVDRVNANHSEYDPYAYWAISE